MATYAIDCGHTLSGSDYGAVGIKAESNLTREVGKRVINKLKAMGNTVVDCTLDSCSSLSQSLGYRVNKANNYNLDLFVSIHFNCFNGSAHGTEVFTYGGKSFTEANRVLSNLSSLGFTNRGIKDGSNLYVLRHTKAKAMLIEVCFCDNKTDMNIYMAEKCANAIVEGITGKKVVVPQPPKPPAPKYPDIDHSLPNFEGVIPFNGNFGFIQALPNRGRLDIHLDRHNYIIIQDDAKEGNHITLRTRTGGSKKLL
ncbi:TPA: N-acetylmuramoyl-L-alanine amidase [Clostridium botulinum]|nr:N-acetylmuramoyl-L-alanine amidase [Clostridium botulinum]HDK7226272.1 N-acetylmuramoyl-L-alanine amidase [Clostridium botulinum]HDK7273662.1 N-acetylmuramoyl-L-alanine amidase [Clostridium botulinum]HDK7307010.1 N-acetylmuramoyl-L-alanine amidase [Clostridium botulinum]